MAEEEPVVIKVMCRFDFASNPEKAPLYQEIERRFNAKFEFEPIMSDAWASRLSLMLAEDKLPDMLWNVMMTKADANKYGAEGYFLDMTKYLDVMPNYSAVLESIPSYAAYVKDENGAIYGINKIRQGVQNRMVAEIYINQDWLTRLNLEVPSTIDELYDVLVAFRDNDADGDGDLSNEIPLSLTMNGKTGARTEALLRAAFGIYGYNYNTVFQVGEDGKVYLAEATENWKAYIKFMRKLYDEKLLDNNIFVYSDAEYQGLLKTGNVGIYGSWTGVLQNNLKATLDNPNKVYQHIHPFFGVSSEYTDGKIVYPLFNTANPAPTDVICANTEHPELICQIVDFFFGEEGKGMLATNGGGIDGKDVVFEEGYAGLKVSTYPDSLWKDQYASYEEWTSDTRTIKNTFQYIVSDSVKDFVWNSSLEDVQRYIEEDPEYTTLYESLKVLAFQKVDATAEDYPNIVYSEDETRERSTLVTDINSYIATMKAAFITGEKDIDATWDEFQSTLKTMGLDRLLEIEQQAYDRYAANL